ncbi:unnamed protein product, partial [Phaeothamnion confervicola]
MSTLFALSPVSLFGPGSYAGEAQDIVPPSPAEAMARHHSEYTAGALDDPLAVDRSFSAVALGGDRDALAEGPSWFEVDALSRRMGALNLANGGGDAGQQREHEAAPPSKPLYIGGGLYDTDFKGGKYGVQEDLSGTLRSGSVTATASSSGGSSRGDPLSELDSTAPSTPSPNLPRAPPTRVEPEMAALAPSTLPPSPTYSPPAPAMAPFAIKLLVSNSMAGTVIGKAGIRISEIKQETDADIKVTPNGRFFPGTHERVVLVMGEPLSVQAACARVVSTIYNAADPSLDITQRLLVPDAAAGLIIGPNGARISELREATGLSSVHVATRDMSTVPSERPVTLQGPLHTIVHALSLLVDCLLEDPPSSRYHNMSTIYRGQERVGVPGG